MVEKQKTWTSLILYNDAKVLVADIIWRSAWYLHVFGFHEMK